MQIAIVAADFTRRRSRPAAPRDGGVEAPRRPGAVPRALARRHGRERLHARIRRAHLQADPGLRRIRLSRIARRQLRAAHLCRHAGSSATTPRPSSRRCSTRSRWASTQPAQLVQDARAHGVAILPPDVLSAIGIARWKTGRGGALAHPHRPAAGALAPAGRRRSPIAARAATAIRQHRRPRAARRARPARSAAAGARRRAASLTGHRHQRGWRGRSASTRRRTAVRLTAATEPPVALPRPERRRGDPRRLSAALR